jgi:hypothetical protein
MQQGNNSAGSAEKDSSTAAHRDLLNNPTADKMNAGTAINMHIMKTLPKLKSTKQAIGAMERERTMTPGVLTGNCLRRIQREVVGKERGGWRDQ